MIAIVMVLAKGSDSEIVQVIVKLLDLLSDSKLCGAIAMSLGECNTCEWQPVIVRDCIS